MKNKKQIKVVDDQFGAPTYVSDLANIILNIIESKNLIFGIFHYSSNGNVSWFDFSNDIKDIYGISCSIIPIKSNQLKSKVMRPFFSILDNSKIYNNFSIEQPDYLESLRKCISIIKMNNNILITGGSGFIGINLLSVFWINTPTIISNIDNLTYASNFYVPNNFKKYKIINLLKEMLLTINI